MTLVKDILFSEKEGPRLHYMEKEIKRKLLLVMKQLEERNLCLELDTTKKQKKVTKF